MAGIKAFVDAEKLLKQLRNKAAKAQNDKDVSAITGYTASYALYVHEDLEALHGEAFNATYAKEIAAAKKARKSGDLSGYSPWHSRGVNQQAKFLEKPARELSSNGELTKIVVDAVRKGMTMGQALLRAVLRIQRESMKICPVDKGILRESAFSMLETTGEEYRGDAIPET